MTKREIDPVRGWVTSNNRSGAELDARTGWNSSNGNSSRSNVAGVKVMHGDVFHTDNVTNSHELNLFLQTGISSSSGERITAKTAKSISAVYRCVELLTGVFGHLPFQLKRRVNDITSTENVHNLHKLLNKAPNRFQVPSEFKKLMFKNLLMCGNGYAHIVRSRGEIVELMPVNPDEMQPILLDTGDLVYRHLNSDGMQTILPSDDVFHFRGPSFDGVTGVSVLSAASGSIGIALATEKHTASTFKNGAVPGAVLESDEKLGKEAQQNLSASLEDYRGNENAGKTLVLEEGVKFKPLTMSMVDSEIIKTRQLSNEDIYRFFGVPPHLAGDISKSTSFGKGLAEQTLSFIKYTMQPHLTLFEEVANKSLLKNDDERFFKCNTNAFLQSDLVSRTEAYIKQLQYGIYNSNEIRGFENKNPRPGGDRYYEPPNTAGDPQKENKEK